MLTDPEEAEDIYQEEASGLHASQRKEPYFADVCDRGIHVRTAALETIATLFSVASDPVSTVNSLVRWHFPLGAMAAIACVKRGMLLYGETYGFEEEWIDENGIEEMFSAMKDFVLDPSKAGRLPELRRRWEPRSRQIKDADLRSMATAATYIASGCESDRKLYALQWVTSSSFRFSRYRFSSWSPIIDAVATEIRSYDGP